MSLGACMSRFCDGQRNFGKCQPGFGDRQTVFVVGKLSFERGILMDIGQDTDGGAELLGNCVRVSRNWEGFMATQRPRGFRVSRQCESLTTAPLHASLVPSHLRFAETRRWWLGHGSSL